MGMWLRHLILALGVPGLLAACGGGGDGPRVLAQAQALQFGSMPTLTVGGQATVLALASSGLPVVYGSRSPAVCAVDAATGAVTAVAVGVCTVEANQSGNADWAVAPARQIDIAVQPRTQQLAWAAGVADLAVGATQQLQAVADSGLAVEFSSLTPDTCTVAADGGVQGTAAGTCVVAADQPGDSIWAPAARASQRLQVLRRAQLVGFAPPPTLLVTWSAAVAASASSGLPVAYGSLTPAVCSIDRLSGVVTGLAVGDCSLTADQEGAADWQAAPAPAA